MRYAWSLNGPGFPGLGAEERGLGVIAPLQVRISPIRMTTSAPRVVESDVASATKALRIAQAMATEPSVPPPAPPTPPPSIAPPLPSPPPPPPPINVVSAVTNQPVTPAMMPTPVITLKPVAPTVAVTASPVTPKPTSAPTTVVGASQAPTVAPQVVPGVIRSVASATSAPVATRPSPFTTPLTRVTSPTLRTALARTIFVKTPATVQVRQTTTPVSELPKPAQQAAVALATGAATDAALYSTSDVSRTSAPATATVQNAQETVKDAVADQREPTSVPNTGLLVAAVVAAFVLFGRK